ncbi:isopentenyl-diphosphate Delta-isomerase [Palleronia sediminis]|uniref:Isopentenyl-diphosphate Delta-isomerase n=1 Tax=Palleronia sediminis TaxID=2547833 RepID=A0A4R6AGE7_9RHOB|nr:isopentenyl-diphosphate Delta-isomerase [Palleronia sediminis]TDL81518.1 isopentenyl-diphosphate Delta-isomerase [Palleronia sediminis]
MTILIPAWRDGRLQPVEKLAVHRLGLRHKAVSVFAMRGRDTLLQRRAAGKYHTPGLWTNACCTHPHWDEAPSDCATRRMAEELGLDCPAPEFRGRAEYRTDVGGGLIEHELVDIFVAEIPVTQEPAPDPDEVDATRWVGLDDLLDDLAHHPARYTPWLRIYLAEHRTRIFGDLVQA